MSQKIDAEAIKQLANILKETGLSEIEYECHGVRIYISKSNNFITNQSYINEPQNNHIIKQDISIEKSTETDNIVYIKSPMVGTVYLAAEPGASPFISIGSKVNIGDTLLIVEAMKVMNPIKATQSGIISRIFVQDSKPVEYDETLVEISID